MSEQAARQPMTNGEREILFQMQKLFAKWLDTVHMCLDREANRSRYDSTAPRAEAMSVTKPWFRPRAFHLKFLRKLP